MSGEKPREIAIRILQRRETEQRAYTEELVEAALEDSRLAGPDRGLLQELVYGVVRQMGLLDWLIAQKTGPRPQKPTVQILLRLGLYQLFWLDRIPDHAAVHETVELARRFGCGPQAGFINALLRRCLRERPAIEESLETIKNQQPAIGFSHPEWLCQRWERRWGAEALRSLLAWNNTPAEVWARVNTLRTRIEPLRELWAAEKVEARLGAFDWTGELLIYQLTAHPPLNSLRSFKQGFFYVQDPSTLLAVRHLNPQPGERVLDWCAAPGGKTTLIAQCMGNQGQLTACEPFTDRAEALRANLRRMGVTCAEVVSGPGWEETLSGRLFDRVLADVPCSNTGVLRRRVDLRWRLRPADLARLAREQLTILSRAAHHVRRGGVLVYSTCSLEAEENEQLVKNFLETHPEFSLQIDRALTPFTDNVDGAYVARLVRA